MTERPIIFGDTMVRAILGDTKTQTRRVIKPQPGRIVSTPDSLGRFVTDDNMGTIANFTGYRTCPFGAVGDRLWVREAIRKSEIEGRYGPYIEYVADGDICPMSNWAWQRSVLPPMFMPRGVSRITLEITDVRVQRVQDISEADVIAEGCESVAAFRGLWDSINAKRGHGWEMNDWVFVIAFKVLSQ